jgi:hypothetical protein
MVYKAKLEEKNANTPVKNTVAPMAAAEPQLIKELLLHDFAIAYFIHSDFIHLHTTLAFDRYIFDQPSYLRHIPILYLAVIPFQLPLEASPKS